MAIFKDTVMIKAGGLERAVKVTVDAPNPEALDIQRLAQEAWLQPSKRLKVGDVTVKVER